MSKAFYVKLDESTVGPVTKTEIERLFKAGRISLSNLVSTDRKEWRRLELIEDLSLEKREQPEHPELSDAKSQAKVIVVCDCGKRYRVVASEQPRRTRCPACKTVLNIPARGLAKNNAPSLPVVDPLYDAQIKPTSTLRENISCECGNVFTLNAGAFGQPSNCPACGISFTALRCCKCGRTQVFKMPVTATFRCPACNTTQNSDGSDTGRSSTGTDDFGSFVGLAVLQTMASAFIAMIIGGAIGFLAGNTMAGIGVGAVLGIMALQVRTGGIFIGGFFAAVGLIISIVFIGKPSTTMVIGGALFGNGIAFIIHIFVEAEHMQEQAQPTRSVTGSVPASSTENTAYEAYLEKRAATSVQTAEENSTANDAEPCPNCGRKSWWDGTFCSWCEYDH